MATTIKSTGLDFNAIKNNLKTFLSAQDEFSDFNFEASGLSNILDVLAYNTHYNGLIANFALNESFLGTAQLRSSLISISEGIGYIPDSRTSSTATVNLKVNLEGESNLPQTLAIPTGTTFSSTIDNETYKFQTTEPIQATNNGSDIYFFKTLNGSTTISLKEGTSKTKTFIVGPASENDIFVIPNKNLDLSTVIVKVFENTSTTTFTTYTSILEATSITEQSQLYVLKESPNGFFELTFGNGTTLGKAPEAGNKVEVTFLESNGEDGNNADTFTPDDQLTFTNNIGASVSVDVDVTTLTRSSGGGEKESIESIRKNAPFQYAAQNRMVTAADYASLVLRNFSTYINDIQAWGGQDNDIPEFGAVYLSIDFVDNLEAETIANVKQQIIALAEQLAITSFNLRFTDPITTFIETNITFQFNPTLTTLSLNAIQQEVDTVVANYFTTEVGSFEESFRRSNLLTLVDDVSPAVLSSRCSVKMQQRLIPQVAQENNDGTTTITSRLGSKTDYLVRFPVDISSPDDLTAILESSNFTFQNKGCVLRNKLNTNIIQIIDVDANKILVDNIGTVKTNGDVQLIGFAPDAIPGGVDYIKISVTPANQSAISPVRNNILSFDEGLSATRGNVVTST